MNRFCFAIHIRFSFSKGFKYAAKLASIVTDLVIDFKMATISRNENYKHCCQHDQLNHLNMPHKLGLPMFFIDPTSFLFQ